MIVLNAGPWQAVVSPERGARVTRLTWKGAPVLRETESPLDLERDPMLYGMPFLFPPNRVADGRFTFRGTAYTLPLTEPLRGNHIHGLFADAEFQVLEATDRLLTCQLDNTGEYLPFPCRVIMRDRLGEEGFSRETQVINTGPGPMPAEIGFHTTFAAPGAFRVPLGKRWETDDRFIPTGTLLELDARERQIVLGEEERKKKVSGFYTAAGHTAEIGEFLYTVSENFTDWVLFSRDGEDWLCVEPQSGPVNEWNRPDCRTLEPGESLCFRQLLHHKERCV